MDEIPLRKQISNVLGAAIPPKGYNQVLSSLDRVGKIGPKQLLQIVILLAETVEKQEQEIAILKNGK